MDKVNKVGKKLGDNKKETNFNIRRGAENFPLPEIAVTDFNKLYTYKKTFDAHSDAPVKLDIKLKEITTPCSINPPITNIWCRVQFVTAGESGSPGTLLDLNGDFIFDAPNIIVPENGCYGLTWASAGYGIGINHPDHHIIATFYHNGRVVRSVAKPTSGYIWTLGPGYWVYPAISHLYQVIEAKAGDTISATWTHDGITDCWEWWGCRRGYVSHIEDTTLRVDLVASAESV